MVCCIFASGYCAFNKTQKHSLSHTPNPSIYKPMQKFYTLLSLLVLLPLTLKAEKWTPETLPMVYLQDSTRYICNPDGVLSTHATSKGDQILRALETDKGVQTVVVVVKQLEGDDPYTFGMALGRKYGIGSIKQRTGLIIILATEDRSYQILTGNGLEGTLPDAICRRIQNRIMVPELKKRNWDGAILKTIEGIDYYIRQDATLKAESKNNEDSMSKAFVGFCIAISILGGCLLFAVAIVRIENKCPKCRQAQMRPVKRQRLRRPGTRHWYIHTIMRCPRCGYEKTVDKDEDDNFANGGGPVPPFLMGGGGSRDSSSGGFGGGIFGGGSFGGGGSGGRF